MAPKNPGIVEKLVRRTRKQRKNRYSPKAYNTLEQLFKSMFVDHSSSERILGNTQSLSILTDGTPVETGERPYRKFLCDCRKQGNWKCECFAEVF